MEHGSDENTKSVAEYVAALWRHKGKIIVVFSVIFTIAAVIAKVLPAEYKSEAVILIEQQSIPQNLVRSTVTSYAGQRIQVISQRVMSTQNLQRIIEKFNLYQQQLKEKSLFSVIGKMRDKIKLEMVSADVIDPVSGSPKKATIAFKLAVIDELPKAAQQVANELVSLYLNENVKRRSEVAAETSGFLALEARKLNAEIVTMETKLAEFKATHSDNLPELKSLNRELLNRAEQWVINLKQRRSVLRERQIYLRSELAQRNPETGSETGGSITLRLRDLQAQYTEGKARYADNHPYLVRLKRQIQLLKEDAGDKADDGGTDEQLQAKRRELNLLRERYSQDHPEVKRTERVIEELELTALTESIDGDFSGVSDDPVYVQLKTQLEQTKRELVILEENIQERAEKISIYEERLLEAPRIEREYNDLVRNHGNAFAKYREIKAKQMEAEIAQEMEENRKGERFSLIEPPLLPEDPESPNRIAIVVVGFVLALAGGIGVALLFDYKDPSIRGSKALAAIDGALPLITIPVIETEADRMRKKKNIHRYSYATVVVVVFVVCIGASLYFMPKDVSWAGLRQQFRTIFDQG